MKISILSLLFILFLNACTTNMPISQEEGAVNSEQQNLKSPIEPHKYDRSIEKTGNDVNSDWKIIVAIPTLEQWVTTRKSESDLRHIDFNKVYHQGQESDFYVTMRVRWMDQCLRESDYSCRLVSYLLDAEGNFKQAIENLNRSCSSGKDMRSCTGLIVDKKVTQKIRTEAYLKILDGCSNHDPLACELAGRNALENKRPTQALSFFGNSCKEGNLEGCSLLASAQYEKGQKEEAVNLASKICDKGYSRACFQLGYMLTEEKDTANAMSAYKIGCDGGDAESCLGVGLLELNADRIQEAFNAWGQACNNLEGKGCYSIGLTLLEKNSDRKQAWEMFMHACTLGEIKACEEISIQKPSWL